MLKRLLGLWLCLSLPLASWAQSRVVDLPTRPDVTLRLLFEPAPAAKANVILLAGGHGGLQIFPNGSMKWGDGNFVVRSRQHFVNAGLTVAVVDAPSDRQSPPFLAGFRQTPEHASDLRAVIAWMRAQNSLPVWLVGTSRGTQSAAYLAMELAGPEGPDGVVLTSSILSDPKGRPLPAMPLETLKIPVLVVHHEQDGCSHCAFADIPKLMNRLPQSPRHELLAMSGGSSRGDPCEAFAHHGFNGIEAEVVSKIADWILKH